jgi:tRNA-2-methylthio-N6-dimethylallyladenosine synthase
MKKIYVKTMGCQMNVYDSQRIVDLMKAFGYEETTQMEQADLMVLNTCHIREKATDKVYSELGRFREIKEKRLEKYKAPTRIVVTGCVVQAAGEEMLKKLSFVDAVLGPQRYHLLPQVLAEREKGRRPKIQADFSADEKFDALAPAQAHGARCFLAVQEGCDKFCSYCVVPYTRGSEYSRPIKDILEEAKLLLQSGAKDITLLGQNVNAFHGEDKNGKERDLGYLIRKLAELDGLKRMSYVTSYPSQMTDDLISAHQEVPQLIPYLHLPIQSGSDKILKAMNRRYTTRLYEEVVEKLREKRPDIAMSSDFIVGFPEETDEDFEQTMRLVQKIGYTSAFSFKYSRRPGTPASVMRGQVPEKTKTERLLRLQELILSLQKKANEAMIGKTTEILLTERGKKKGQLTGYSPYMQNVHVEAPEELLGSFICVKIKEATATSLTAERAGSAPLRSSDDKKKG